MVELRELNLEEIAQFPPGRLELCGFPQIISFLPDPSDWRKESIQQKAREEICNYRGMPSGANAFLANYSYCTYMHCLANMGSVDVAVGYFKLKSE